MFLSRPTQERWATVIPVNRSRKMLRAVADGADHEPLGALLAAADDLYTHADDATAALDALLRADEALRRVPRTRARGAELARAAAHVGRSWELAAQGAVVELREAANRLYESAVLLLDPYSPGRTVHVRLLRVLVRDLAVAAMERSPAAAERAVVLAVAACRAFARDVAGSPSSEALRRALEVAGDAARMDLPRSLADGAERALASVDALEEELASRGGARREPGPPGMGRSF